MISRSSKVARAAWAVCYLFFLVAGVIAFFLPAQVLMKVLVTTLVYTWASTLTVGGGVCLYGKLRGTWAGEIIGLPFLCGSNWIFGILLLLEGSTSAAIAIGFLFCGVGAGLIGRWLELRKLAKANMEVNSGRS